MQLPSCQLTVLTLGNLAKTGRTTPGGNRGGPAGLTSNTVLTQALRKMPAKNGQTAASAWAPNSRERSGSPSSLTVATCSGRGSRACAAFLIEMRACLRDQGSSSTGEAIKSKMRMMTDSGRSHKPSGVVRGRFAGGASDGPAGRGRDMSITSGAKCGVRRCRAGRSLRARVAAVRPRR